MGGPIESHFKTPWTSRDYATEGLKGALDKNSRRGNSQFCPYVSIFCPSWNNEKLKCVAYKTNPWHLPNVKILPKNKMVRKSESKGGNRRKWGADKSPMYKSPTDRSPMEKSPKDKSPKRQKPKKTRVRLAFVSWGFCLWGFCPWGFRPAFNENTIQAYKMQFLSPFH